MPLSLALLGLPRVNALDDKSCGFDCILGVLLGEADDWGHRDLFCRRLRLRGWLGSRARLKNLNLADNGNLNGVGLVEGSEQDDHGSGKSEDGSEKPDSFPHCAPKLDGRLGTGIRPSVLRRPASDCISRPMAFSFQAATIPQLRVAVSSDSVTPLGL